MPQSIEVFITYLQSIGGLLPESIRDLSTVDNHSSHQESNEADPLALSRPVGLASGVPLSSRGARPPLHGSFIPWRRPCKPTRGTPLSVFFHVSSDPLLPFPW